MPERVKSAPDPRQSANALPEPVIRLGWISFFTDVASEMLYPVIPLFLTATLGVPVAVLGAIEGAAEAIVSVMKGLSGWHSDRLGQRVPYIRWGYGLGALSKPLMALAFSWPLVFFARALDRLGKGLRTTARDALIADAIDPSLGGKAFGFHRMMDTAGALVGVLLALGMLSVFPGQYRLIFLLTVIPGALAVWLTFKLKDLKPSSLSPNPQRQERPALAVLWRKLPAAYWITLGPLMLFAFANSSDTLLILRARNLGLSDVSAIMAYMLFNLVYAASVYPLGTLSDRIGRWPLMLSGWTVYAGVYFGFAFAGPSAVWWLFALYGLYMGLCEGVGRALVRDKIPEDMKGTAMGIFNMAAGLMALAGSLAAGLLWDIIGPGAAFVLGGAASLSAVVAAVFAIAATRTTRR